MSRYRGPKVKLARRLGDLPTLTSKTSIRPNPPGQHGALRRKTSPYALRLQEKQKIRLSYGLREKQLYRYVLQGRRSKEATGKVVLSLLERRLDMVTYRNGFYSTLPGARQLVTHGHISVNGRTVQSPSYLCNSNETLTCALKIKAEQVDSEMIQFNERLLVEYYSRR